MFGKGQLGELQKDLPLLKRADLGLAAISYDSRAALHDFASRQEITFPPPSDHESVVIRACGVADRRHHKGAQLDVDASGDVPVYGLAYPSVFVLSLTGVCAGGDLYGRRSQRLCINNPYHRNFLTGLVEDYTRSYEIDGIYVGIGAARRARKRAWRSSFAQILRNEAREPQRGGRRVRSIRRI